MLTKLTRAEPRADGLEDLYREQAVAMIRLALMLTGDRGYRRGCGSGRVSGTVPASSDAAPRTSLIGINPQTGATVKLPVRGDYVVDGIEAAW